MSQDTKKSEAHILFMRLSKPTIDAVKALVLLARNSDAAMSIPELASACAFTEPVAFKLVPLLVKEGFAATDRGRSGGVRLGRPAETISIGEVVRALEKGPLEGKKQKSVSASEFSEMVDEAFEGFLQILDLHAISDLAKRSSADVSEENADSWGLVP
ncbi:MAG: Rrf2 family transcriptional regulator [Pseudomonadota bacterium]